MAGKIRKGSEEMEEELSELMKKVQDVTLQQLDVDDITSFSNISDRVLALQELREKELKGYIFNFPM
jgi:hypothetical protein